MISTRRKIVFFTAYECYVMIGSSAHHDYQDAKAVQCILYKTRTRTSFIISFRFPFDAVSICITSPLRFKLSRQRMPHSTQMNALVRRDVVFDDVRPLLLLLHLFRFVTDLSSNASSARSTINSPMAIEIVHSELGALRTLKNLPWLLNASKHSFSKSSAAFMVCARAEKAAHHVPYYS